MIKIEFPAGRRDIAEHLGRALLAIGTGKTEGPTLEVKGVSPDEIYRGDAVRAELAQLAENVKVEAQPDGNYRVSTTPADTASVYDDGETDGPSVDEKGVPFDAKYCARAKEPFYMSGSMKGQWKKGRGVDHAAYDAWYQRALQDRAVEYPEPADSAAVAALKETAHGQPAVGGDFPASTMFAPAAGAAQAVADAAKAFSPEPAAAPPADAPDNAGKLMAWVSAKQAAKVLTQDDINQAYQAAGVQIADLFGANAAQACGAVYSILVQKAGA